MRSRSLAILALLAACRERTPPQATATPAVTSAPARSAPTPADAEPVLDSSPVRDMPRPTPEWFAEADSVLRLHLASMLIGAPQATAAGWHECDYSGDDNPHMLIGVALARPVGHDTVEMGSDDNLQQYAAVQFRVELTSVVRLAYAPVTDPAAIPDSTRQNTDPYAAVISPRVDTLSLTAMDYGRTGARWAVCYLYGHIPEAETPYGDFIKGPMAGIRIVSWNPPNGSWARVHALADSIRQASR